MDRAKIQLSLIEFAVTQFSKYSMEIEGYFENEIERIDTIFSTISVEQDGYEIRRSHPEEYVDFLSENYQEMETIFPNHFRVSFLIQIMSLFEYELKRVCNIHCVANKSKYTIGDLYGTDLEKCKKYLEKVPQLIFKS